MFGSTYILSPQSRFFWGLGQAVAYARSHGGALSRLADAIEGWPIAEGKTLPVSSVFHQLWMAALANHVRYGSIAPPSLVATGLCGVATDFGLPVDDEAVAAARDSHGRLVRPDGELHIVECSDNGPAKRLTEVVADDLPIVCIGRTPLLEILMGDFASPLSELSPEWVSHFREALQLLAEVSPEQHSRCLRNVRVVAGLDGPRGQLHSVSIGEWPGGVALRCFNPPPHICDSFVHETGHQLLDAALAQAADVLQVLEAAPASYSPFFEQPRPAIKVWHGIVSYLEVLRFWEAYLGAGAPHPACDGRLAESRIAAVREMCLQGICSAYISTSPSDWPGLASFIERLAPAFRSVLPLAEQRLTAADRVDPSTLDAVPLSEIQRAEILLALAGHKTSRISIAPSVGGTVARALPQSATPLFSRRVHLAAIDPHIGSFSNRATGSFEYHKPPPNSFVYAYIARSSALRRMAAVLDEVGEAGELFGIPACCRRFFAQRWDESCRDWNGDLASLLLAQHASETGWMSLPWQLNVFAMYHGLGLTWHFPCDLTCAFTIELVTRRSCHLSECDRGLRDRLVTWQKKPVIWSPRSGIITATQAADDRTIDLTDASQSQKNDATEALLREGQLVLRDGMWETRDGRKIRDFFDTACQVLTWY